MLQPTGIYILSLSPVAMWSTQTHTTHGCYLCLNSCQLWSAHLCTVKWIKLRFPLPPDLSTLICMLITSLASVSLFYPFLDFLSTVILIEFLALNSVYGEETEARWCRGAGDSGDCLFLPPLSFHWSKPRWASWLSWMLWMLPGMDTVLPIFPSQNHGFQYLTQVRSTCIYVLLIPEPPWLPRFCNSSLPILNKG